jgi:hypothetical protein
MTNHQMLDVLLEVDRELNRLADARDCVTAAIGKTNHHRLEEAELANIAIHALILGGYRIVRE